MTLRTVFIGGQEVAVTITREGSVHRVQYDDRTDVVELVSVSDNEAELRVNGQRAIVPFLADGASIQFMFEGQTWRAELSAEGARRRSSHREHSMSAPMPGMVLKISIGVGDVVTRGMPLLVLEAMKMEHQITAPYDGTVEAINCSEGEMVQPGLDLVTVKPKNDEDQR
jgi:3-methylcrotonyl-CoA carboxylase alpha subunit